MGRRWGLAVIVLMLSASNLSAQSIVCPGTLPVSEIQKETTAVSAERLLKRFMAAFGLHALSESPLAESDVIERYKDHPDQLLTKLNYLAVQCQMLLIERPELDRAVQQEAIRRTFLDYILSKPDPDATSLTKVIDDATAKARADEVDPLIRGDMEEIENALAKSDRLLIWQKEWFRPADSSVKNDENQQWSVITASPCYEDEGWRMLRAHQACWPNVHFELHGPINPLNPYYAIVAGRGLTETKADKLVEEVLKKEMPQDSFASHPNPNKPSEPNEKSDADQKSKTMWCFKKPDGAQDTPNKKKATNASELEAELKKALCNRSENS